MEQGEGAEVSYFRRPIQEAAHGLVVWYREQSRHLDVQLASTSTECFILQTKQLFLKIVDVCQMPNFVRQARLYYPSEEKKILKC